MVLARWQATIVDDAGNVQNAASVEVRHETGGAPLATIYSDRDGVTPLANPLTTGSDGFAAFHAAGGAYKITATKGSFSREWRYVPIGTAGEIDANLGAVTNALLRVTAGNAIGATGIIADAENNIAWSGNLTQTRIGGLWIDEPDFNPTPTEGVNIARLERLFVGAACDNDGTQLGEGDWLSARVGFSTTNSEFAVVAAHGRAAITAAIRAIDNDQSPSNGITCSLYNFNDNSSFSQSSFGLYIESQRSADCGFTTCMELDPVEFGTPVSIHPYSSSFAGVTSGIWLASGGEEEGSPGPNDVPVGLAFINNNAKFEKGIYFHKDSIAGTNGGTGTGTAIALALGHKLDWYGAGSTIAMSLYSPSAGNLTIGSADISTGNVGLEIGAGRTGDGLAFFDLHAASGSDFNFRVVRNGGANGSAQFNQAGTGPIQVLVNGAEDFRSDGSGIQLQTGKRLAVGNDQVVAARRTGWTAWTGTADRASHAAGAGATAAQMSGAIKALIDDLIAHGLIGA